MLARILERHHRLVRLAAFAVCLLFGVRAMADALDAIGDASAADVGPARTPTAPRGKPAPAPSKSGAALAERNIFCSDCQPPQAQATQTPTDTSGVPPATDLPLRLIATHIGTGPASSATVLHDSTGNQGAYRIGDRLPGAGEIVRIGGRSLDFENPAANRVERLAIAENKPPPEKTEAKAEAPAAQERDDRDDRRQSRRGATDPALQAALDSGVKAIDENTFEVDRKLVEDVLARPQAAAGGARILPRQDGLRVMRVRPDSAHARLGLKSGDTIQSVNGIELSSGDKMLEAITQLRNESNISLTLNRRGQPVTLSYRIR
jgi:general secretion pathway protein C